MQLAVDLGTNTLRWFAVDAVGSVDRGVVMCGLGRDLDRTAAFDPEDHHLSELGNDLAAAAIAERILEAE